MKFDILSLSTYGISDLMRDQSNKTADTTTMTLASSFITDVFGYAITVGVYGLIAGNFIQTAIDLAYIAIPPVRPLLVTKNQGKDVDGLGYFSGFDNLRDEALDLAQRRAMEGDYEGAANRIRFAQSCQQDSIRANERRVRLNQERLDFSKSLNKDKKVISLKNRCLISNELKSLINQDSVRLSANSLGSRREVNFNLKAYLRRRSVSIAFLAICIMMLIVSNVFIHTGMNVGAGILKVLGAG